MHMTIMRIAIMRIAIPVLWVVNDIRFCKYRRNPRGVKVLVRQ
jgi:hypothetical protein